MVKTLGLDGSSRHLVMMGGQENFHQDSVCFGQEAILVKTSVWCRYKFIKEKNSGQDIMF